jgi:hypothetical protein
VANPTSPHETTLADTPSPAARPSKTGRDMLISLVVLLVPLALIVGLFRLRGGEDVVIIDPSQAISQAESADLFPVAVPQGLSDDWRSVSAAFNRSGETGTLRVGYLTPDDGQVQLLQTNEDPAVALPREFGDEKVEPTGQVTVDGDTWRTYRARGDELALVFTDAERTLLIQGRAAIEEFTALAASLN